MLFQRGGDCTRSNANLASRYKPSRELRVVEDVFAFGRLVVLDSMVLHVQVDLGAFCLANELTWRFTSLDGGQELQVGGIFELPEWTVVDIETVLPQLQDVYFWRFGSRRSLNDLGRLVARSQSVASSVDDWTFRSGRLIFDLFSSMADHTNHITNQQIRSNINDLQIFLLFGALEQVLDHFFRVLLFVWSQNLLTTGREMDIRFDLD